MKAVRLIIRQSSANYRREETIDNKMTYPLPPYSTVIGAIHKACGYREYHPMDISIQGTFGALKREVYQEHCFLNSTKNDRGILVKMKNPDMLSKAFIKVASAKKSQGNDFRQGITIQIHDKEILDEYRRLKDKKDDIAAFKKDRINPLFSKMKEYKKILADRKKTFAEDKERLQKVKSRESEIKSIEKEIKSRLKVFEEEEYSYPYSKFRTLTCGPKYYEVLSDLFLVIHVLADETVMQDIVDHQFDFTSLGRSEDFIEMEEATLVELEEADEGCTNSLPAYIPAKLFDEEVIQMTMKDGIPAGGTRFFLPKKYELENGIRKFDRKAVIYTSQFEVYDQSYSDEKVYKDAQSSQEYLVCFV